MITRRDFLITAGNVAGAIGLGAATGRAQATPAAMRDALQKVTGQSKVTRGRVKLELPPLVENGNTVALTVTVASPMTAADHVRAIHVFAEKNPQPSIVSAYLGSRAGKATVSTRVRLADTQTVIAIAQMSDGSFWSDSVHVIVTLAACLEEIG